MKTREDNDTKGTVFARHLIQSFLPGEVDSIKAHEIGMELSLVNILLFAIKINKDLQELRLSEKIILKKKSKKE